MDTLDLIISLDILSFPAALPVFNLVDSLRISSSVIGSSRIGSFDFANSAILDTLESTNFSNPLFAELWGVESFLKWVNHSSASILSDIWLLIFVLIRLPFPRNSWDCQTQKKLSNFLKKEFFKDLSFVVTNFL